MGTGEVPRPARLVGRQRELGLLRAVVAGETPGRGRFVVIEGEAGIGKSRLLVEMLTEAAERGFRVLRSACDELEGMPNHHVTIFQVMAPTRAPKTTT